MAISTTAKENSQEFEDLLQVFKVTDQRATIDKEDLAKVKKITGPELN